MKKYVYNIIIAGCDNREVVEINDDEKSKAYRTI
jgi:hypothetical protein